MLMGCEFWNPIFKQNKSFMDVNSYLHSCALHCGTINIKSPHCLFNLPDNFFYKREISFGVEL